MEDIQALLISSALANKIEISETQAQRFQLYMEILLEWNEKMNLTTITVPQEIVIKHFLDSIIILKYCNIPDSAKLIDVGTGAGFPGIPLKLLRPKISLTLLDGLNKRLIFLKDVLNKLNITAELVHARGEEGGRQRPYRENFDFATARAVAPMNILCEYCLPFLKFGGTFIAMKGPKPEEELAAAKNAIGFLGCELSSVSEFDLPSGDKRSLVFITRIKPLAELYPRHGAKIKKNPL